ncbi:hypothetical protein MVEN_00800100 [Mycena venus]|uniref:Cellobiose dehydrogenase cytochrome domain-containing protein n=1 Tax=Mycena venus TaxID=2733690 RepID=A0A8H6YJ01_9AGAR|nr:hypothetical protein MVEN_00800100 [Mycena venus]
MLTSKALTSLAIIASAAFLGAHAQCQQNAGYLGAFDATTGNFVGAVGISLGGAGIFTLDKTGNTTNYLSVVTFTNTCNDGGPVFIQIVSPVDASANFVSLVAGVTDCPSAAFTGPAPWAAIAAADGFPHGQYTTPGTTRTTLQGDYHNLKTFCGECMTFALGNALGRQVLLPQWKDPNSNVWSNLPVVQDSTFVRLLATPNVQAYSRAFSNAVVQQVYLSVFLR